MERNYFSKLVWTFPSLVLLLCHLIFFISTYMGDIYDNISHYRSIVATLQHLTMTRPNLSYISSKGFQYMENHLFHTDMHSSSYCNTLMSLIHMGLLSHSPFKFLYKILLILIRVALMMIEDLLMVWWFTYVLILSFI